MVYVLYRHARNLRHVSPQNRLTLKEFETTTREIGLIILRDQAFSSTNASGKRLQWLDYMYMKTNDFKMHLNVSSNTFTYSNCIACRLFYC